MSATLPYLTAEIPPIPLRYKTAASDFVVEEIPRYAPCGSGDHIYVLIEKTDRTTRQAVSAIARALAIPAEQFGVAGQKDARGVTRQYLSVPGVDPARVRAIALPQVTILDVARHRAKLRLGDLQGNRFQVRLRDLDADRLPNLRRVLDILARRGVPNYFGLQRFGMRGDTWEIGRALARGEFREAVAGIIGRPNPGDPEAIHKARELGAAEQYIQAARAWPERFEHCRALCRRLAGSGGDARRAVLSMDRTLLGFYVSAFQAGVFNQVLAQRLSRLDEILAGDVGVTHTTGASILVRDPAPYRSLVAQFEVSPTGPLVGHAMIRPEHEPAAIEENAFVANGIAVADLPRTGPLKCIGRRRPLRFRPEALQIESGRDGLGLFTALRFTLPAGCYATALLREIGKGDLREG